MTDPAPPTLANRPRNAAATRAAILDAARGLFIRETYDQVGVRQIAGEAGVDAALICRYFGSKEDLFAEVVANLGGDPMEIFNGAREDFGLRVARAMLDPEGRSQRRIMDFINLAMHSTMSPTAGQLVRRHLESHFIQPLSAWLGGAKATNQAWLTASALMGVALMRSIVCGPSIPSEKTDAAILQLAAMLQSIIDNC